MSTLASVKSFDALLEYLEHELDWPIDELEIDDLTFDYDPEEELGLDPKTAAKIRHIKQLRPLRDGQPFGIFFIEFEPKRLPVTVLRRILGRLVTKKRSSANPADRQTWHQDDLIFASVYGDNEHRRIDFAHFADDAENGLATLRVLGWDDDDTDRKLDWVEGRLKSNLAWPSKENSTEWRTRWRDAFILRHREAITTSKKLAEELAFLAQRIRKRALSAMAAESKTKGQLRKLHRAFQDSLIHDLDEARFADTYAQTIAYGLLSAAVSRSSPDAPGNPVMADDAVDLVIPQTSPFLKELMAEFVRIGGRDKRAANGTGIDFDELGVNDVVELLRHANMQAVIADFGRERPGEDPVIHFYEYFMTVYDKKEKIKRGVFYTPKPVVTFIVRSVDEILREEFGLPLGLADTTTWGEYIKLHPEVSLPTRKVQREGSPDLTDEPIDPNEHFVQILDPATGTGTFLVETIDLIHKRMVEHWKAQRKSDAQITELWNQYVPEHLLPRLYGFELMMAPYAIAHMKIGLKLTDTKYRFQSEQRIRVFLTNSLEPPTDLSEMLEFVAPFLAHEARAANTAKGKLHPSCIIGNPPYAIMSGNLSATARELVEPYRRVDGEMIYEKSAIVFERTIQDDYVKFFALAGHLAARSGVGVLGYISNNSYQDNINLRGLRSDLLRRYASISLTDLNGAALERGFGESGRDENVFDIRTGVAICLAHRSGPSPDRAVVRRASVVGTRDFKYNLLARCGLRALDLKMVAPRYDKYLFVPQDARTADEFACGISMKDLFMDDASGVQTGKDAVLISFTKDELRTQLRRFASSSATDGDIEEEFDAADGYGRKLIAKRNSIAADSAFESRLTPLMFSPFDQRVIFYRTDLVKVNSDRVSRQMLDGQNICFVVMRQVVLERPFSHVFVTRALANQRSFYSTRGTTYMIPWFRRNEELLGRTMPESVNLEPTLCHTLLAQVGERTQSAVLHYAYAQLYSEIYRIRFDEFLKGDYPRVFRPRSASLFDTLCALGQQLVAQHLLEPDYSGSFSEQPIPVPSRSCATSKANFFHCGDRDIGKAGEKGKTMAPSPKGPGFGRVYINETAFFDGVPEAVWKFHIGGYQVCHKWLSDRKGRTLTDEDIAHYHKIVIALNETIRIMAEIDKVIDEHGGWPGAFVTDTKGEAAS